jgi:ferredoxin
MSPLQVSSESYTIHVSHQGQSADLKINQNESILSALERSSIHDKLSLSKLPQECRRGNCLTCSSRHAKNSNINNVELREDGLSPSLVDEIKDRNFVLTCSSYVLGDGVELELDVCDDVWREIHIDRVINDEDGERIRNEAVAKTIRMANEKNYYKWSKKTEKLLMESDDE